MQSLSLAIWDLIFPPPPESFRLRSCQPHTINDRYQTTTTPDWISLSHFHDPIIHDAIVAAKFQNNLAAARLLGLLLRRWLQCAKTTYTIVPIPLHRTRYYERGFNQVERIIAAAATDLPHLIDNRLLSKVRATPHQTTLDRSTRLTNLEDSFAVTKPTRVTGTHILLVDDVVTTGATLSAAKAVLWPHSPTSITCLAIAH